VGLDELLLARRLALDAVADPRLVVGAPQPRGRRLHAGRQRAGRQVLAVAAAEPGAEEHAQLRSDELIDAEAAGPRRPAAILRHRGDAGPPPVMEIGRAHV